MSIVESLDMCVTDMQAICNNAGDDEVCVEIAVKVADDLTAIRNVTRELLAALKAMMPYNNAAYRAMVRIGMTDAIIGPARVAIAKAEGSQS